MDDFFQVMRGHAELFRVSHIQVRKEMEAEKKREALRFPDPAFP